MKLPIVLSSPHAGLWIPPEVEGLCVLKKEELAADGDEGAREIYDALANRVERFVTAQTARAIVDLNREEQDRGKDGVIKTHTCWDAPVYRTPLEENIVQELLSKYYRPYHAELGRCAAAGLLLGVDCHTMASQGPPVGPDPGKERPKVCLSDGGGRTLPSGWMEKLARCFRNAFGFPAAVNDPFKGGYITRRHGQAMPWVQLELSRQEFMTCEEKSEAAGRALWEFVYALRK